MRSLGGSGSWLELAGGGGSWYIRHRLVLWLVLLILVILLLVLILCWGRTGTIRSSIYLLHKLKHLSGVHRISRSCRRGRCGSSSPFSLRSLGSQFLQLLRNHFLVLLLVHCLPAMLFEFHLELLRALQKLSLFIVIFLFNGGQLCLQLLLVHGQALHLPPQHRHAGGGHHAPNIWHHILTEDLIDQFMIPHESCMGHMLHTQTIIRILLILSRLNMSSTIISTTTSVSTYLNINPSLTTLAPSYRDTGQILGLLHHRSSPSLGLAEDKTSYQSTKTKSCSYLNICLVRWAVVVKLQLGVIFNFLTLILVSKLTFFTFCQVTPHLPNDPAYLPQLQLGVLSLHLQPK